MSSLRKFIYWCLTGLFICFIGMSNVFGAEYYFDYSYTQNYYNNNGSSGNDIGSTWNPSLQAYVSNNIYTIANSYGGGVVFNSPIPLLANHTYTMSLSFLDKNNIALSSKNHISISNNPSGTASVYFNNNFGTDMLYSNVSNNSILSFAFKANRNDTYIFVPFTTTTTTTQSYIMTSVVIDDLGSEGISQQDINNSINSQTNVLNNSIQASTNTITGALQDTQDSLSQDIQDMGEDITGAINDNFNSCKEYNISYNSTINNSIINSSGYIQPFDDLKVLVYEVEELNINYNFTFLNYNRIRIGQSNTLYDSPGGIVNRPIDILYLNENPTINNTYSITPTKKYLYFYLSNDSNVSGSISFIASEKCINKIDETNDKLNELNNNLTDTNVDTSSLDGAVGWLPPGPVDSIINLPLTMFNSLLNALGKTCTPLSVPLPYVNENLEIPCLTSIYNRINGVNSFWTWVGGICSVLILYNYLLSLYHWVDETLSLRENTMPGYYDDNFGGGA